jgi:hypothetical protein
LGGVSAGDGLGCWLLLPAMVWMLKYIINEMLHCKVFKERRV